MPSRMLAETPGASRSSRWARFSDQLFRLLGIIEFPRLTQRLAHAGMQGFGEALGDVAGLVNLAALDRRVAAEGTSPTPTLNSKPRPRSLISQ